MAVEPIEDVQALRARIEQLRLEIDKLTRLRDGQEEGHPHQRAIQEEITEATSLWRQLRQVTPELEELNREIARARGEVARVKGELEGEPFLVAAVVCGVLAAGVWVVCWLFSPAWGWWAAAVVFTGLALVSAFGSVRHRGLLEEDKSKAEDALEELLLKRRDLLGGGQ